MWLFITHNLKLKVMYKYNTQNSRLFLLGKMKCSKCKKILTLDSFTKNKATANGLSGECKICKYIRFGLCRQKYRKSLSNQYIEKTLRKRGLPKALQTPELIETQRELLTLKRKLWKREVS
jgi:hypothetical protein